MILQLFIFAILFVGFGIFSVFKKKRFVGGMFILLGLMLIAVGSIAIYIYPHINPF